MRHPPAANPYQYGAINMCILLACVSRALTRHTQEPRSTVSRTEYTDDILSAPGSGNARAPCRDRSNGRSPADGSSWPASFSLTPTSLEAPNPQEARLQAPYYQASWLPVRPVTLPQAAVLARFQRPARPAPV